MKYVTTERFIVSSNTPDAHKKYHDNYDAVFRKDEEPEMFACESCSALRARKSELGGIVFTMCDSCWDKRHEPADES